MHFYHYLGLRNKLFFTKSKCCHFVSKMRSSQKKSEICFYIVLFFIQSDAAYKF